MVNQKFENQNEFLVWYDQLGHPRSIMMRKKKVQKLMLTPTYESRNFFRPMSSHELYVHKS